MSNPIETVDTSDTNQVTPEPVLPDIEKITLISPQGHEETICRGSFGVAKLSAYEGGMIFGEDAEGKPVKSWRVPLSYFMSMEYVVDPSVDDAGINHSDDSEEHD